MSFFNLHKIKNDRISRKSGFTIVELLIVIVIIGILAALVIVAYNGIQARANDSKRITDMRNMKTAIQAYYIDNGTYPPTNFQGLSGYLVPEYIKAIPSDSINAARDGKAFIYYYTRGYKKNSTSTGFVAATTDDFIISMTLESSSAPTYNGYGAPGTLNWIDGN